MQWDYVLRASLLRRVVGFRVETASVDKGAYDLKDGGCDFKQGHEIQVCVICSFGIISFDLLKCFFGN